MKNSLTIGSSNPTPGFMSKGNETGLRDRCGSHHLTFSTRKL